ncbi:MAG: hypothetical protein NT075_30680 [Chloroflexi bacterium]|nr:hypothetical protein [Chloroflexota bacterium]
MNFESIETFLPDEVNAQLDQRLAVWRSHRQLGPLQVATLRQAILEAPEQTSTGGWEVHVNYLNRSFAQINFDLRRFLPARGITYHYQASPKNIVQLHITPDWQPYLKLA